MKKLPKIYQNKIEKTIKNNKEYCYLVKEEECNIEEELTSIFSGIGHSYNIPILLKTKEKVYETSLVSRTKNNVITLENDIIPISDIIYLKRT